MKHAEPGTERRLGFNSAWGDEVSAAPIGRAQFHLFSATEDSPVSWRLLSGNNRELGRGADRYLDVESCIVATKQFVLLLDELVGVVRPREDGWAWWLSNELRPFATCTRAYDRQARCDQALVHFRQLAAEAVTSNEVVVTATRRWAHHRQGHRSMTLSPSTGRTRRRDLVPGES